MTASRRDLVGQLATVATDLAPALGMPEVDEMLRSVCTTARRVYRAAACSVAELDLDAMELVYREADGEGADGMRGLRLSLDRGVASYVATSGQALVIDEVRSDPRFAADVADRTGYIPRVLLVVPVVAMTGEVLGVLSILDPEPEAVLPTEVLDLAAAFADQAALAVSLGSTVSRLGDVLLRAFADAVATEDTQLATALRRRARSSKGTDGDVAELAARFGELSRLGPGVMGAAGRIVDELITYATATRGRRS